MFRLFWLVLFFLLGSHWEQRALADEKNDELILVQALWRHGDRSPVGTFKTDIYQEDHWPQGWGQLSPRGMAQHVRLGKQLRERYVFDLKFIGKQYNSHEVYVRSTDYNRTLISAISNLIGFYGPGSGEDYPKELGNDWPGWYVPIPIHTISGKEDWVAPNNPECPRQAELRKLLQKTPEYTKAQEDFKGLLDFLRKKTGEKMADPFACWLIGEAFMIERLNNRKLVDWAEGNGTLYNEIKKCEHLAKGWLDGHGLSQVDGFDFRMELAKMRGGPMLWKFIANMQDKLRCEHGKNMPMGKDPELEARKSPFGAPLCKWMNPLRYYAFSAHDSTIASLFSALGFEHTNYDDDGVPPYSACVTVELWRQMNKGEYYLKVLYWRPGPDSTGIPYGTVRSIEITKDIEGCPSNGRCTLEQFIARSRPYEMLPSPKEYCHKQLQPPAPDNSTAEPPAPKSGAAMISAGFSINLALIMAMAMATICFLIK